MLDLAAICIVVTAVLAYVNQRFIRLPLSIGVMTMALSLSLAIVLLSSLGFPALRKHEEAFLQSIDFSDVLLQGMLSFLLFAGALHVNLDALKRYRWQVASLAVVGTILSTLVIGAALRFALPLLGLELSWLHCLLFGALISPTDPVAVLGILKSMNAPKPLEVVIAGESLFNDGVGVVMFSLLLGIAASGSSPSAVSAGLMLLQEAGGGVAFGLMLGVLAVGMLKSIDQYHVEVLITLAVVVGGYALASRLHISGPLAMVVAGLMVGNRGRSHAMSDRTRQYMDMFWDLLDEILNAVLFVLLGLEVLMVEFSTALVLAGALAILIALGARLLTVGVPVSLFRKTFDLPRGSPSVLVWGGLRGGISVALALWVPAGRERLIILAMTYCVVVFSIFAQGLTVPALVRRATQE
ncbi:MAG: sodium:proton antiporter [Dokdonella sp.]